MMIIYRATNIINNKSYIGQTLHTLNQRKKAHIRQAKQKRGRHYFGNALHKYGKGAFIWDILDRANTLDDLNILEKFWVEKEKTLAPDGYNLEAGGKNNIVHEDTKQKLSKIMMGHIVTKEARQKIGNAHKGKKISNWHKQRLSEMSGGKNNSFYGKEHTIEIKQKLSVAAKGNTIWLGRHHTEETKQKIAKANKDKKHSKETKRKMSEDRKGQGGIPVIIKGIRYISGTQASQDLKCDIKTIFNRIKSKNERFKNYFYAERNGEKNEWEI